MRIKQRFTLSNENKIEESAFFTAKIDGERVKIKLAKIKKCRSDEVEPRSFYHLLVKPAKIKKAEVQPRLNKAFPYLKIDKSSHKPQKTLTGF